MSKIFDSIINKTPLLCRTNRIGGAAPSEYLAKLEKGNDNAPPIEGGRLDAYLKSHLINPDLLRSDDFDAFMNDRQKRLLAMIELATGKSAYLGSGSDEGESVSTEDDKREVDSYLLSAPAA